MHCVALQKALQVVSQAETDAIGYLLIHTAIRILFEGARNIDGAFHRAGRSRAKAIYRGCASDLLLTSLSASKLPLERPAMASQPAESAPEVSSLMFMDLSKHKTA